MKKISVFVVVILVLTFTIFKITSSQFFVKIDEVKPVSAKIEEVEVKSDKTVRIVIMDNNRTTMYHSDIKLESNLLKIYYDKKYKKVESDNEVEITPNSKYFKNSNVIKIEADELIEWKKSYIDDYVSKYNGALYIYKENSGLVVVNQLGIEDYVAGVISSEIGEDTPMEALKAQAICARTYITDSNPKEYSKYKANADDSTNFQVYNKVNPGENCKKAAKETSGLIMLYKNKPINAYYFSTSCGYTTDYKIWGTEKLKYLKGKYIGNKKNDPQISGEESFKKFIKNSVKSYEKECPFYRWNVYISKEQIENSIYRISGIDVGNINDIEINKRGSGGVASQITVYGSVRQIVINSQNQIRKALCSYYANINLNDGSIRSKMDMLPSAFIVIENEYKEGSLCGFNIYGGGFGHGSGLSQNGAIEMAKKGKKYQDILKFFYNGITITVAD